MTQKLFYRSKFMMYSRFELFIPVEESAQLESLFLEIIDKTEQIEQQISKFIPGSETSRINSGSGLKPVKVNSFFFNLIEQCLFFYTLTGGYFSICMGERTLNEGFGVTLNKESESITLNKSGTILDFGAIGKGIAVEQAVEMLKSYGITQALINFGDSSVYGLGSHPHGDCWPFTVSNGYHTQTFSLKNNALSSSGLHAVDDKLIPHIINPENGKLVSKNEKVVVISASPVIAEILSTAIYAAPASARDSIRLNFPKEEIFIL
jgi:thiamine biosynthesis lipoprotein